MDGSQARKQILFMHAEWLPIHLQEIAVFGRQF